MICPYCGKQSLVYHPSISYGVSKDSPMSVECWACNKCGFYTQSEDFEEEAIKYYKYNLRRLKYNKSRLQAVLNDIKIDEERIKKAKENVIVGVVADGI